MNNILNKFKNFMYSILIISLFSVINIETVSAGKDDYKNKISKYAHDGHRNSIVRRYRTIEDHIDNLIPKLMIARESFQSHIQISPESYFEIKGALNHLDAEFETVWHDLMKAYDFRTLRMALSDLRGFMSNTVATFGSTYIPEYYDIFKRTCYSPFLSELNLLRIKINELNPLSCCPPFLTSSF